MSRLGDIRAELTEAERVGNPEDTFYGYVTYSDVRFLLERIQHLQRENEQLRTAARAARSYRLIQQVVGRMPADPLQERAWAREERAERQLDAALDTLDSKPTLDDSPES